MLCPQVLFPFPYLGGFYWNFITGSITFSSRKPSLLLLSLSIFFFFFFESQHYVAHTQLQQEPYDGSCVLGFCPFQTGSHLRKNIPCPLWDLRPA